MSPDPFCTVALKQDLAVIQADFTMERRLYATGGEARSLYSELVRNMMTRAKPDGGAIGSVCSAWISKVNHEVKSAGGGDAEVEERIASDLRDLQEMVGGYEFAEVLKAYYRGWSGGDTDLQGRALRWLRAEYTTKTEARQDLGVRRIIDDDSFYDSLKLLARFCRKAGFDGLLVALDELVVLTHRLPSTRSRTSNFEAMLTLLNDAIQGHAEGIGFVFAGTDDCLEDRRRGLFSYEALRSRLAENQLASTDLVDLSGPVIRLQALSPEDLYVLLRNVTLVHANGDEARRAVPDDAVHAVLHKANETLGAEFFKTPRDIVRSFVGLLNILDQNPGKSWREVLGSAGVFNKPTAPLSLEEEIETGASGKEHSGGGEDDLASFKL